MFKTAVLAASIAATTFAAPAYPGVPSAVGDVTCTDSPSSKAPFEEGKEFAAKALAGHWVLWADPNGAEAAKVLNETTTAKRHRETYRHALDAIGGFLARVKGDWTPDNVTEGASILRDLGLDVWQVRSFVGDGKGGNLRTVFLVQVEMALTGAVFPSIPLDDPKAWRDFVDKALNQKVQYAEDQSEAVAGLYQGLGASAHGISPLPFLFAFDAEHGAYSYLAAARVMTESLNTPASKAVVSKAWLDGSFIGDRATTTQVSDEGRRMFDALPSQAMFFHPNGRLCIKVSPTHSRFFEQWYEKDEIYRGPDGHLYRISDNSLVK